MPIYYRISKIRIRFTFRKNIKEVIHKILTIIALVFCTLSLSAQNNNDSLQISVLTCANGDQIYTAFGHCAFRAVCKSQNIDKVYNYGVFSYKQNYFVLKFVRGFLDYSLAAYNYSYFQREYSHEGRKVKEQILNLNASQTQALYDFLEWNALPENKYYKYNFLEDNCATKIRDIIQNVCGNEVVFPDSTYNFSLRDQINIRIADMPWYRLGVSLLMGLPVDKKANTFTIQFLPDYIYSVLNETQIIKNGEHHPIVASENIAIDAQHPVNLKTWSTYISPSLVFWLIFIIWATITYFEVKKQRYHAVGDKVMLFITGLFGILFLVMWFLTEHTVTAWNLNILWANPLHIVAAFNVKKATGFWKNYFKITAGITAIMLIFGPIMPQQYDIAFYPIICIILLRLIRIAFCKRQL